MNTLAILTDCRSVHEQHRADDAWRRAQELAARGYTVHVYDVTDDDRPLGTYLPTSVVRDTYGELRWRYGWVEPNALNAAQNRS